uniref:Ig-like domain-containing protein n=1 Tax=Eptatretus burgeri TaxID=7764 RepID=A0A8C4N5V0_EPTBU
MHIDCSTVQRLFLSGLPWLYLPPFTLALVQMNVEIGGNVTLPCLQQSSKNHQRSFGLITWFHNNKTVFLKRRSGKVLAQDKHLRMVNPQNNASLMILGASEADAGHYKCSVEVEGDSQTLKVEVQLKILPDKNTTPADRDLSTVPQKCIGWSSGSSSTQQSPHLVPAISISIPFVIAIVLLVLFVLFMLRKHHKRSHLSNPYTNNENGANVNTTQQQELSNVQYEVMSTVEPPLINVIYEKMLHGNVSLEKEVSIATNVYA